MIYFWYSLLIYLLCCQHPSNASSTIFVKRSKPNKTPLIEREFVFVDAPQAFEAQSSSQESRAQPSLRAQKSLRAQRSNPPNFRSSSNLNTFGQAITKKPHKTITPSPPQGSRTGFAKKGNTMVQPSKSAETYQESDWQNFMIEEEADYELQESTSVSAVLK